ncbi:hypothetical protein G7K_0414-t1 [Saitoella complicata NRRL Y-17804]|uniref:Uncharacterized protein n=1 Tax=Saitoella complicata (strain BCRC 22490 / CBS 7301 / JCM 7358 / NBRC 10748 / NRRL Y-17804) TaxID=698492 RepID=A0A0E9N8E4_SAICN|nr:hypothetical protein G7K_0414-t1 [Saitoella complicata NRRL Y-17804]
MACQCRMPARLWGRYRYWLRPAAWTTPLMISYLRPGGNLIRRRTEGLKGIDCKDCFPLGEAARVDSGFRFINVGIVISYLRLLNFDT